jgi:4-amino-4-deoxy-L-arabinose transferase-like glycosyltransferase
MNPAKPPQPEQEPSLLDYLKDRLKFWKRGPKIAIPSGQPQSLKPVKEAAPISNEEKPDVFERSWERVTHVKGWPWRSILALVFALLAQRTFEPSPNRTATAGLILYGFAFGWLVLAYTRKEWRLAGYPEGLAGNEDFKIKRIPLILAIVFSVAAFATLGDNLFTLLNVTLWILAIGFFVWAFWLTPENQIPFWSRIKNFLTKDSWQLKVTRWTLLILAVVAVVVFFRINNIGGVPPEPFSDHAEKILDVYDVSQGQTHIFFPRNTGREAIQMYLTLVVSWIFGTGLSFLSLKIGTVFCGLVTLPYMYLLGKEFGGKRIGLLAVLFTGIAYWPNVISRVGLRFPLYPLFVAPTLYYLLRGLRNRSRNDMVISGLFLGFGLHGYSPFRIMPIVVVIAIGLYLIHAQSKGNRKQAITWLVILALAALVVFLPLARYWMDNPESFSIRAFSRLGTADNPLPGPAWQIFLSNTWNALRMFNWDDGVIWVHSVVGRPALDVVSGALFLIGIVLVLIRYIRQRHWQDLFLLLTIPLLQLPSILSLAFPEENPALNRAAGALVPTFLVVAVALDSLLAGITTRMSRRSGAALTGLLVVGLFSWSAFQNYNLVFNQYATDYSNGSWNSSEMGAVIKQFGQSYGSTDNSWIVPYPYWVDTRLPGVWAGIPNRDFAIWPQDFSTTVTVQGPKLFIVNVQDTTDIEGLGALYPQGIWSRFISKTKLPGKDFMIFFIPPAK